MWGFSFKIREIVKFSRKIVLGRIFFLVTPINMRPYISGNHAIQRNEPSIVFKGKGVVIS